MEAFRNIFISMGAFQCSLLLIIGKLFQDAGLKSLCIESGVIAEGSVAGIMEGHKYNHVVHLHKLVYEALMKTSLE